jgi:transposase-like protein
MDDVAFCQLEQTVRADLTAEQCIRIERAAQETAAAQLLDALIGEKTISVSETRVCILCGACGVVKNGHDESGLQRFSCNKTKGCGVTFTVLSGTPLARMRKKELFVYFIKSLLECKSVSWIKEFVGISRLTAWRWRHRILEMLKGRPNDKLKGIVEGDETFFLDSFKGHRGWKRGHPPANRPPRYRGSKALKRGISSEQIPVVCAVDRQGAVVEAVLENHSDQLIVDALVKHIEHRSVICSDGRLAYATVSEQTRSFHYIITPPAPTPEQKAAGLSWRTVGALTLGRVNEHHCRLKKIINCVFNGVSTRYLSNYLTLLRQCRRDPEPRAVIQETIS